MKLKNFFAGIIIGFLISTTAFAAVQEYTLKQSECKIVVDGEEVKGELPLLIMDPGFNYIPAAEFRSICDKMGIGFEFDSPTKEIRIDTTRQVTNEPVPTVAPEHEEVNKVEVLINKYGLPDFSNYAGEKPPIEDDGENRFFTYEGIKYISIKAAPGQRVLPKPYNYNCPAVDGKISYDVQLVKDSQAGFTVLIEEIPYALYSGNRDYYIEYDYYLNTILPLIKE